MLEGKKIIERYDFRYPDTLRICFDTPVGVSSYGFSDEELYEFFSEKENFSEEVLKLGRKCNLLEEEINDILYTSLTPFFQDDDEFDLDWRDDCELEVHGGIKMHKNDLDTAINLIIRELKNKLMEGD